MKTHAETLAMLHASYTPRTGFIDLREFALSPKQFRQLQDLQAGVLAFFDVYGYPPPDLPGLRHQWEKTCEVQALIGVVAHRAGFR